VDQSVLVRVADALGSASCPDLREQVVDVALDGDFSDLELLGDLGVGSSRGDSLQDLGLSVG
jgi:hypothetical protein